MMARHRLVRDDRDLASWPKPADPLAQASQQTATDRDVIGAVTERNVDRTRVAGAQRHGHDATCPGAGPAGTVRPRRPSKISSTMVSCGTSRDSTVRSASA